MDPFPLSPSFGHDSSHHPESLAICAPETLLEAQQPSQPRGKVLVVEDDPLQLRLLEDHLRTVGFDILSAMTLAEARQALAAQPIQLAILDVQLPDGSGFDLCEQIDNESAYNGMPVVMLSSLRDANIVRKTRAAGGRYFLSKPYDPNVLLAIIERALSDY
jgi:DNA-binding response OmpR family regulator